MMDKELYQNMKNLQSETKVGLLICRHILEKHGNCYVDALAYINSGEYKKDLGLGVRRSEPVGYDDLCSEIRAYNWNDGFGFPRFVLDHPDCDLALAMEIFYDADGYGYFQILLHNIGGAVSWLKFVGKLCEDIEAGRYSKGKGSYQIPLNAAQKHQLRRRNIAEIFLQDIL